MTPTKRKTGTVVRPTVQRTIKSHDKNKQTREEEDVHLEDEVELETGNPPVTTDGLVGSLELSRSVRMALAFNSLEVGLKVTYPVPNLKLEDVADHVAEMKTIIDDALSSMIPEVGETLVRIGEFRDEQEAEYRLKKKLGK